jgi:hypothetical protein
MSFVNISFNIMSPSKERNCDNIYYIYVVHVNRYIIWWLFQVYDHVIKCLSLKFKMYEIETRGKR